MSAVVITKNQLNIMRHALGIDDAGISKNNRDYFRNRFVTDLNTENGKECQQLVAIGMMEDTGPLFLAVGMHLFMVSEQGRKYVDENAPKPEKLTRGQRRYREFLELDMGLTFKEFLMIKKGGNV